MTSYATAPLPRTAACTIAGVLGHTVVGFWVPATKQEKAKFHVGEFCHLCSLVDHSRKPNTTVTT